jgi:MoaA/NifB/PqqE/SkfB family radical SAM enzyme
VLKAVQHGMRTVVVSNGMLAETEALRTLRDAGLNEITFSIDTLDKKLFRKIRKGADLPVILDNFKAVPAGIERSLFAALSRDNYHSLIPLIDFAADNCLAALTVSDLNFPQNAEYSLAACKEDITDTLEKAIEHAEKLGLLLLSPHFHNVPDIRKNYRLCRVNSAGDLCVRATAHAHCLSPWRIAAFAANGTLMPCNCAPRESAGIIDNENFESIWNGDMMKAWRKRMMDAGNETCMSCPRY